ncbi:MAG: hypothetical protein LBR07_09920 [Puniceicoccales bacterium]|nr:hypothetical protein [Puniceicoccales bacterium]
MSGGNAAGAPAAFAPRIASDASAAPAESVKPAAAAARARSRFHAGNATVSKLRSARAAGTGITKQSGAPRNGASSSHSSGGTPGLKSRRNSTGATVPPPVPSPVPPPPLPPSPPVPPPPTPPPSDH